MCESRSTRYEMPKALVMGQLDPCAYSALQLLQHGHLFGVQGSRSSYGWWTLL
jgi:hypothetical protein